ncbi:MAG: TerB family tellurite resistance protein [Myxococcales bacterium]|nr:TerB family tellurite resistance protein [Myxococcales bacterium]
MDDLEKHRLCELVLGMATTDGAYCAAENDFFTRLLARLGVASEEDFVVAPISVGSRAAAVLKELSPEAQKEALELLIATAVVDGKVVPAERRYLDAVCKALGVPPEELEQRLAERLAES